MPALFVVSDPASLWVQIDAREIDTGILKPGASQPELKAAQTDPHVARLDRFRNADGSTFAA